MQGNIADKAFCETACTVASVKLSFSCVGDKLSWERGILQGNFRCYGKFIRFRASMLIIMLLFSNTVFAQIETGPPEMVGLSHEEIKSSIEPFTDGIAAVIASLAGVAAYILKSPPAAILLSAAVAFWVTMASIRGQRETARIRLTFETVDKGIWSTGLIDTRTQFREIRDRLERKKQSVAKYETTTSDKQINHAAVLHDVMKDYENISLGIRNNILDEDYLYLWMRNTVIADWEYLSPLVTSLRTRRNLPTAYIEFERLAKSWQLGRSYTTGKKVKFEQKGNQKRKRWGIF